MRGALSSERTNRKEERGSAKALQEEKEELRKLFVRDIFINREYSWLLFNRRVLEQSLDRTNPLLERCRFLSIFSSNLDEFFRVRVGRLANRSSDEREDKTGLTAKEELEGIALAVKDLYRERGVCFSALCEELSCRGLRLVFGRELTAGQRKEGEELFSKSILPLLSPVVLDAKHPLMQFENQTSYRFYDLVKNGRRRVGVMALPASLGRLYPLGEKKGGKRRLILLEELIRLFGQSAFPGYEVRGSMALRVTRSADFDIRIDDSDFERDFPALMKGRVKSRARMAAVRLEVDNRRSRLKDFALRLLELDPQFCFEERFFDYRFLSSLGEHLPEEKKSALSYPPFRGAVREKLSPGVSRIDSLLAHDLFLSYPYDSMDPFFELLEECAEDARVSAVRITVYRLARASRVAELLCRASEKGKQVTVVIELCARFDEENNLYFAARLREAGCTVIYGMGNYKVHSKILSVVLKQGESLCYITHLGTGNYNEITAKQYTDLNLFTADRAIGEDAAAFFRSLAVCSTDTVYRRLLVAPATLGAGLLSLIERETAKGRKGYILAKMNSLTDRAFIEKLAEAGMAGVRVELLVRGVCCLLPGLPGRSENIRVVSVVGRFLEHSRVYSFGRGKDRVTYISSADLMTRNTEKRVEIAAPVLDREIEGKILSMLRIMLADNVKARRLESDGRYRKIETLDDPLDAQKFLLYGSG